MPPQILTAAEAAEAIGMSYKQLLSLVRRGEVPHIRTSGRVYFNMNHLVESLRAQTATAGADEAPRKGA